MKEKTQVEVRGGGVSGSQDIPRKTASPRSKVPFPQMADPTPSQEESLVTAQSDSDPWSCFTPRLLVPTPAWGTVLRGGGVCLSSRHVYGALPPNYRSYDVKKWLLPKCSLLFPEWIIPPLKIVPPETAKSLNQMLKLYFLHPLLHQK